MEQEKKSTHKTEVVRIKLEPCPNADSLSIVHIWEAYPCIVRTADWQNGDLGAFIVPDSVVDTTRPEFSFLHNKRALERITVRRFRGNLSYGLLVKAPEGSNEGDDVSDYLGITRYEPQVISKMSRNVGGGYSDQASPPKLLYTPIYDVESFHRYHHCLDEGESIIVSEKVHGSNIRMVYYDDIFHVGTHRTWRKETETCTFWKTFNNYPEIKNYLKENPGQMVFGELYGIFNKFEYDTNNLETKLRLFDVLQTNGSWITYKELEENKFFNLPWVPIIGTFPYNKDKMLEMSIGKSTLSDHIREGIVIRPLQERNSPVIGRVVLKVVSPQYLEMK